jgi:hypothetical protein
MDFVVFQGIFYFFELPHHYSSDTKYSIYFKPWFFCIKLKYYGIVLYYHKFNTLEKMSGVQGTII